MTDAVLDLVIEELRTPERAILGRLEWRVGAGEHWAIVGPNGAGKTTLLRVLAGYVWPTRGHVTVLGRRFGTYDLGELRREIGVVSTAIQDRVAANELVGTLVEGGADGAIGASWRPTTAPQRDAAVRALGALGADHLRDRAFGTLSQGERQRVLIARALASGPALVLLDEPCAGLDPIARDRFLADLATLAARPDAPGLVLVTHHVDEIPPFVSHLLAMRAGTAVASGPIREVLTSEVMSRTFGAPCRVERSGAGWRLVAGTPA